MWVSVVGTSSSSAGPGEGLCGEVDSSFDASQGLYSRDGRSDDFFPSSGVFPVLSELAPIPAAGTSKTEIGRRRYRPCREVSTWVPRRIKTCRVLPVAFPNLPPRALCWPCVCSPGVLPGVGHAGPGEWDSPRAGGAVPGGAGRVHAGAHRSNGNSAAHVMRGSVCRGETANYRSPRAGPLYCF
jgi:hypothetical protein